MPVVSIKNVSKVFDGKKVLDNVSLDIESGEIFGLLGSNGAGKSTLTSIILGLLKPSTGSVAIFPELNAPKRKAKVSLVPQEPAFYKDFSVEKNMRFFASISGLKRKAAKKSVDILIDWLALSDFRKVKSSNLSGGYQRLLNIALSLLHDPQVVFMDEPTVGLDPKMRLMFWEKIKEMKADGKTVIITTHYMDEAEQLCTRVALMKKGKILVLGKPRDLIKEYGGIKVFVFEVEGGVSQTHVEEIKTILGEKKITQSGNFLVIPTQQEHSIEKIAAVTDLIMGKGYNILSSTSKEPDLEDVFLNLTGEKMGGKE